MVANPENDIAYAFRIAMGNSLIVAVAATLVSLVLGSLASYAFARLRFAFKGKIMYLILFTYMVPSVVVVMPLYLLLSRLGHAELAARRSSCCTSPWRSRSSSG